MERLPAAPPDIASLNARIVALGGEIDASREEIERLSAPGFDGLWVTTGGGTWTFWARRRHRKAA